MTDKEALKLALDALEESKTNNDTMEFWDRKTKAITACEKALASPVQEPVGNWVWSWLMDWCKRNGIAPATQDSLFAMVKDARSKFESYPPAQPAVQEPVAVLNHAHGVYAFRSVNLQGLPDGEYQVYTTPPQNHV